MKWRQFSTARYLAFGEKNGFTCMITLPDRYLRLGKTAARRRRKFRQMLDQYAVEKGMKRDPKRARGNFVGYLSPGVSQLDNPGRRPECAANSPDARG